jgi:hypothetical protein
MVVVVLLGNTGGGMDAVRTTGGGGVGGAGSKRGALDATMGRPGPPETATPGDTPPETADRCDHDIAAASAKAAESAANAPTMRHLRGSGAASASPSLALSGASTGSSGSIELPIATARKVALLRVRGCIRSALDELATGTSGSMAVRARSIPCW